MATVAVPTKASPRATLVAFPRHTAILVAIFLGLAVVGAVFQSRARSQPSMLHAHPNVIPLYLSLIAVEWGLVFYVNRGLRQTGTPLSELIGDSESARRRVGTNVLIAVCLWGVWILFEMAWDHWLGPAHAASIRPFLAQHTLEIPVWLALSASAGFAEEIVFRGYFQRQFSALTGSTWLAWALQAVLFGVSHGYQGIEACAKITIYGALFGLVALWRKSLRPGMIAHALTDAVAGIF
ncbi:MAG: CPBP family intramembrane glutamic endopeptidase [Gemmatimonadaceae bacterium]